MRIVATQVGIVGLFAAAMCLGFFLAHHVPNASAAPSQPVFMVGVNSTSVYRFIDTSGEFASVCYFVRSNTGGEHAISCVRAKP